MNFALYSSDWTDKNLRFKKLLLFAMRMNTAENVKFRITRDKVVNIELFKDVCYFYFLVIFVNLKIPKIPKKFPKIYITKKKI